MSTLTGQVASVVDRDNLVYEIWFEAKQLAEISKEPGCDYVIELYGPDNARAWRVNLQEFRSLIDQGIKELMNNP
ncbi:hypothetical protein LGM75_27665 [Burkholderia multivorans]|uniref:hypothetical protein n=1 Tax=Burkholderia multivorans TaxID=87883 RepID=UPI000D010422|nr:hypothetical protein [Burkholderia multivorans]MBU9469085.1 hypothetical protein [Burkholderia multivorans]MCA8130134.1 hypothetical protein [Burkholderia multivorans]MCA8339475.1 hypothetical protein [Burkholderia multivorans]PRF32075.1 hypothetical protein C6Q10_29390 [Burkholderia multivorans]QIX17242.1 hypothetical protein FOB32_16670 [Burkholderia multivorans]